MKTAKKLLALLGLLTMLLLAACSQTATPVGEVDPQIVNGVPATAGEYPWMVQLKYRPSLESDDHFCGGTLIDRSWVLTAAHCVYGRSMSDFSVVLGQHRRSSIEGTEQTITLAGIIIHPSYNNSTKANDVALLNLASPATLNSHVALVSLSDTLTGTNLRVIGWGDTTEGGSSSDVLMKVNVPRVSAADCNAAYPGRITSSMFCAGSPATASVIKDSCQGDSGGPIFHPVSRKQMGVVSWGIGCARPGLYGVYTDLSRFTGWIYSYTRPFIILDPCLYEPGACPWYEIDLFPDPCIYCIFNLDILQEDFFHIQFALPELGLKPDEFSQAFAFKIMTAKGKLITQGKGNGQEALLELYAQLPKGRYRVQVDVLDPSIAKLLQDTKQYPFQFSFSLTQ